MTPTAMPRRPRVKIIEDQPIIRRTNGRPQGLRRAKATPEFPWDRQPGEDGKTYQRFLIYRDMFPHRSVRAVAEKLGIDPEVLQGIASRLKWVARTNAYIDHLARKEQTVREAAIKKLVEDELRLGKNLMDTSERALELKNKRRGRLIDLKGGEITKMGETGSVLRRRSMGLPVADKGTAVQVNVQNNVLVQWLQKLDEQGPVPEGD